MRKNFTLFLSFQLLRGLLQKILIECNRLHAKSVAMPLLGTGKHNFPKIIALRIMKEEFERFSSRFQQSSLKEIKLVIYDPVERRQKNLTGMLNLEFKIYQNILFHNVINIF